MSESDVLSAIRGGCSLVAGTVSAEGQPRATRAWAARIVARDPLRVRVVMGADDPDSVANLATGAFALTGADVRTLRSVQLKGRVVCTGAVTDDDVALMIEHSSLFFRAVHETDGNPVALLERLLPASVVALEFEVDELYDQSPGPRAGAALAPTTGRAS